MSLVPDHSLNYLAQRCLEMASTPAVRYDALPHMILLLLTYLSIGLPHRSMSDDEYDGYFIPARSIVLANTWSAFLPS